MHRTRPFRLTPQRAAVLDVVRSAGDHPTARDIYLRVKERHPGIGFATVYRTLNLLVDNREILELQLGDDAVARYDRNTAVHQHIRCTVCGAIADVHLSLPPSTSQRVARASGFDIDGYDLQFTGRCPDCRD